MRSEQFSLHAEIEDKHWWFAGRRAIIARLLRNIIPASKDIAIVDVGCGTGGNIAEICGDYTCIGIDASPEAIEIAKVRYPEVQFILGTVPEDLCRIKHSPDICLLLDVLEHIQFDRQFLGELISVLKPGGHILLTVPAKKSLWSPHDANYGHFRRYEIHELEAVWAGLPVTVTLLSYFNYYLYPVVRMVRAFNRFRNREWGAAGTDLSMPPSPVNWVLRTIFASESRVLSELQTGERISGFSYGVSLVSLLRKDSHK